MKPKEPEFLVEWRKEFAAGPPRCCFTCDEYDSNGNCRKFDSRPPDDFLVKQDCCSFWAQSPIF